jgi:hypothetical protein
VLELELGMVLFVTASGSLTDHPPKLQRPIKFERTLDLSSLKELTHAGAEKYEIPDLYKRPFTFTKSTLLFKRWTPTRTSSRSRSLTRLSTVALPLIFPAIFHAIAIQGSVTRHYLTIATELD